MGAVSLINWGIETRAGNHNKENVRKAEIRPQKNLCLQGAAAVSQSGHMTAMTLKTGATRLKSQGHLRVPSRWL